MVALKQLVKANPRVAPTNLQTTWWTDQAFTTWSRSLTKKTWFGSKGEAFGVWPGKIGLATSVPKGVRRHSLAKVTGLLKNCMKTVPNLLSPHGMFVKYSDCSNLQQEKTGSKFKINSTNIQQKPKEWSNFGRSSKWISCMTWQSTESPWSERSEWLEWPKLLKFRWFVWMPNGPFSASSH